MGRLFGFIFNSIFFIIKFLLVIGLIAWLAGCSKINSDEPFMDRLMNTTPSHEYYVVPSEYDLIKEQRDVGKGLLQKD